MRDLRFVISDLTANSPEYIVEDGTYKKLDHYDVTESGVQAVYKETDEISDEIAYGIIFGGAE